MQPQPVPKVSLPSLVATWNATELDQFFGTIDFPTPSLSVYEPSAHWYSRSNHLERKKRCEEEHTPMYYYNGHYYSAQRISLLLAGQLAPERKADIVTECGVQTCVNPYHLSVKDK